MKESGLIFLAERLIIQSFRDLVIQCRQMLNLEESLNPRIMFAIATSIVPVIELMGRDYLQAIQICIFNDTYKRISERTANKPRNGRLFHSIA